ncbi:hypothetical protein LTS18_004978 [Coniosporium uncinatum]|uniref:Uncharacterized protein n=1 Tax=Coniosporium uncinatum TaxID=93489 RepID=A0ACC3DRU7_9PEZI|nr:hypothetical protein LTS18_004978 [Coniosporium uncinatum]
MSSYNYVEDYERYHREQESQSSILGGPGLPALGHAISGASGAALSHLLIYPLDLVITRLQVQKQLDEDNERSSEGDYKSLADAALKIHNEEGGLGAFYSGVWQDTAKSMADSFFFFLAYNFLRQQRIRRNGGKSKSLPPFEEIGVGMLAGAFAKLLTTPVQNIVTRKQTASMVGKKDKSATSHPKLSSKDIALQIRHEKGILGFWSGYSATLILTLNPALTFLLHETLLRALVARDKRKDPGSGMTFAIAAASKAIASTITYPFSLAKSRAQVSGSSEAIYERYQSRKKVLQRSILYKLYTIAKTEGIAALYSGIEGEVLKGFFQHGLTMLMKERIHKVVVQMYYLVLKTLKKYPVEQMAKDAEQGVKQGAENAQQGIQQGMEGAQGMVQQGMGGARQVLGSVSDQAGDAYAKGKEYVEHGGGNRKELMGAVKDQAGDVYAKGKEYVERSGEEGRKLMGNVTDQAGDIYAKGKEYVNKVGENDK